jgi:hypothetical protein
VKTAKTLLTLGLFLAAFGPVVFHYALNAPLSLDENDALDVLRKSPADAGAKLDYWRAIDHPAMRRWVDRAVLGAAHVEIGEVPAVDYDRGTEWNVRNGRVAPRAPVQAIRCANAVALLGALAAVFFVSRIALGASAWAFLVAAPVALSREFGRAVGGSILPDAYLAFFLAWVLCAWVLFHLSTEPARWWRVCAMGVLVGLTVSSKLNGVLVLFAYSLYLLLIVRGVSRLWLTGLFVAVAFAAFVAVNPVMWTGPVGWAGVISDTFVHRMRVIEMHKNLFGESTFAQRLPLMFPYWYFLPLLLVVILKARDEKWFVPVCLWSVFLVAGTAVTVNQPFVRYFMPINMGLSVIAMLSCIAVAKRLYNGEMRLPDLLRWGRGDAAGPAPK